MSEKITIDSLNSMPETILYKKCNGITVFGDFNGFPINKEEALKIYSELGKYIDNIDLVDLEIARKNKLKHEFYNCGYLEFENLDTCRKQKGIVYFVRRKDGIIKIGFSTDFESRLKALSFEHGNLEIIHLVKTNNAIVTETLFHNFYKSKRVEGEWFELNKNDIKFIKSAKYPRYIQKVIEGNSFDKDLYFEEAVLCGQHE